MSGDLTYVQSQAVTNEFLDRIKSLSNLSSSNTFAESIEQLHLLIKRATPNGLQENKAFAFMIVENFYRLVPMLDAILSNNDDKNEDYVQTKSILQTLANLLNEFCLFTLFTTIRDTSRLQRIFKNYIVLMKEIYFTDDDDGEYVDLLNCLLPIIIYSSIFISITENDIPSNLLTYTLSYVKQNWQDTACERLIRNILAMIKVLCKKPPLVPMILRTDWPKSCIQWLTNKDIRPVYMIDYFLYLIIQKLARHTLAVPALNQLNCLQALAESKEQMRKAHTENENNLLDFLRCMIYALLMEANDIKQMSLLEDEQMCQSLDKLVSFTLSASKNELFSYECFHISEMLDVMSKLFVNDDLLIKCIDENNELFDCLCQLLIHFSGINQINIPFSKETLLTVTNLLWSISFHQKYQDKFRNNSMLMHALSNLVSSSSLYNTSTKSTARDISSLKKAAEGILWNLKSSSSTPVAKISNEKSEQQQQQPLAMISYSHSDATFCRELVERLSAYVPVWVDYKQAHDAVAHSDDLWEEIARAMERASVIVLIISKEYYDSKSCRQELSYAADLLKKRIVPVYAPNQQYRASGWLGIRIAGQKYIHFGRKLFTEAIKELASMVVTGQKQELVITSPTPTLPLPPPQEQQPLPERTPSPEISKEENTLLSLLKDWTNKDVRKWFDENQIHPDLITLYANQLQTGTSLVIYARHLKLFYRHEYIQIMTKYQKHFPDKTLDTLDFITLVDALYRLRAEYDPDGILEDNLEKSNEQRLPQSMNKLEQAMTWL